MPFVPEVTGNPLFDGLLVGVFLAGAATGLALLLIVAPYGRHDRPGFGPTLNTRFAWVMMESPAVLFFAWFFLSGPNALRPAPLVLFGAWQLHYVHRAFIYPFRIRVREGARTPAMTALLGALFCGVNGYLNGAYLSRYAPWLTDATWLVDPCFVLGLGIFAAGFALNRHSDAILRGLRAASPGGYRIPYGGGYRLVSCPNYLGELLEWTGFAIAGWSIAGLAFAFFTAANLVPRALAHHRWYRETFDDYPSGRRAVLPYLL